MKLHDTVALVEDIPTLNLYSGRSAPLLRNMNRVYLKLSLAIWKAGFML